MESLRKSHGEKPEGPQNPKLFVRGTSQGTAFTTLRLRLFYSILFFSHPGLLYGIFLANGLPREYHGKYTPLAFKNIKSVKSNIICRNVEKMKKNRVDLYSSGCLIGYFVGCIAHCPIAV